MKSIICEMCGSNELIKEDGVYVCKHCGTKYSLDNAKKLVIDINEKIDVNIDNSAKIANLRQLAMQCTNYEQKEMYIEELKHENCNDIFVQKYECYKKSINRYYILFLVIIILAYFLVLIKNIFIAILVTPVLLILIKLSKFLRKVFISRIQ